MNHNAQHDLPLERWAQIAQQAADTLQCYGLEGEGDAQDLAALLAAMAQDIWRAKLLADTPHTHAPRSLAHTST